MVIDDYVVIVEMLGGVVDFLLDFHDGLCLAFGLDVADGALDAGGDDFDRELYFFSPLTVRGGIAFSMSLL